MTLRRDVGLMNLPMYASQDSLIKFEFKCFRNPQQTQSILVIIKVYWKSKYKSYFQVFDAQKHLSLRSFRKHDDWVRRLPPTFQTQTQTSRQFMSFRTPRRLTNVTTRVSTCQYTCTTAYNARYEDFSTGI